MKGLLIGVLVLLLALTGCMGVIINGSNQDIGINSVPEGALVRIDGEIAGNTPMMANLGRAESHSVSIDMEGYEIYTANLTRSADGGVIVADIFLTGGLGLIIDLATGGIYKLSPDEVIATFGNMSMTENFLTVTLEPI